jgi:hypothetical protein
LGEDCVCCEIHVEEVNIERDADHDLHWWEEEGLDHDPREDDMDGDFDTGMRDAGFGTEEDYGYYGDY